MEPPKCPFDPDAFDPLAPGALADPYPELARARAEAPVFRVPDYDMWCVTRWEDVQEVLSNHRVFSSAQMVRRWPPPPETAADLPEGHPLEGALVSTDPPAHDRVRRLAQKAFLPRLVAEREPAIRRLAGELIDGFADRGEVDIVPAYCAEIPPAVVTQLLGVPPEDRGRFRQWALDAHDLGFSPPTLPQEEIVHLSTQMVDFDRYIRALVAERRAEPRDDLTSYLVHAEGEDSEPTLSDKELVSLVASMVTAGSDTTSTLIGHALYLLLTHPEALARAQADPEIIPGVVEEALRLYPSARAMRRTTRHETDIRGVTVPGDVSMYVSLAAANRDPDVFPDPDRFDPARENVKRHMGFGTRTHFCLGAPLARLEAQVAVEVLLERLPSLRLARSEGLRDEDYERNMFIPSLRSLPVAWAPTGRPGPGAGAPSAGVLTKKENRR